MEWMDTLGMSVETIVTILTVGLLTQWLAFQGLVIHYYFYRQNQKKPRPDGVRLSLLEKTVAFQTEQLERAYAKLGSLSREVDTLHVQLNKALAGKSRTDAGSSASFETAYASLGELNMKKRLRELQSQTN